MLLLFSIVMVLGFSLYLYVTYGLKKENESSPLSKCVPMMVGMTSSLTVGLIIAIWMPQMLAGATILSVLISAGNAFLIGKGFGMSGMLEAQSSSIMGAMMGAMLGVMLSENEITLMVIAMDLIYLVSIFSVMLLSATNAAGKQSLLKSKPASFYLAFLIVAGLIGTTAILDLEHAEPETETMIHMNHNH